ncbi:hypothetical protein D307_gp184 [Bacillus phage Bastille]|uniref:DUF4177 domain-containing protein n=6 Tax=Bastillevirus TaxID=1918010 RepID=A0A024AZT1_9CAUD|nr:hypothetical protein D307_gp184 [Bacillus phage Bastille]YP_009035342.1 hypothetical protein FP73_gp196 [Bacillus phage Hoody T]YP_009035671.1 hypothetical protein FP76_gp220 [Bacillus phage Evoli]YP_009037049.1 hypothetical protein FP74_gp213 [Bacillus phage CAM003]AMW61903.1 hypothetical protein DNAM5_159 [Bacillus phage Vinny]ASU01000.1 hypothetical protein ANTHONY_160 [Bacillus phage Anthony]AEQ34280.1 hypothetical protein [Bacillus phage Bastille]AHZ09583.1 hypothetical protein [Baci
MEKFEYKSIPSSIKLFQDESELNKLGAEGWELVMMAAARVIFKRKIEVDVNIKVDLSDDEVSKDELLR